VAAPVDAAATASASAAADPALAAPPVLSDAAQDAPGSDPAAQAAATQAELDYASIYGTSPYDPVADPNLPAPAQMPAIHDPWEPWNRKVHRFNNAVDRTIATPLA